MLSRELLLEIFRLWQKGADVAIHTKACDVCKDVCPTRRVGKKYWVCAHCTRKFSLWEKDERDKAIRGLLELATRK
jgi:ribosomal protein L37AE/L43A